jgi:geranylgeranyl diphosphate synthase, type II
MDNHAFFSSSRKQIEEKLDELLFCPSEVRFSALFSSARYSIAGPGKRLRPLLVLATAATYGISTDKAIIPACALEMIHTYSLIHDDLPCMDDDDLRRGKPALHKVVPEWQALLTGDFLLTYAFEILSNAPHLSAEQKVALIRSLSLHAGAYGMIGGQMIDLLCEGKNIDWDVLETMHLGKTASLIAAALEFGALIADAPTAEVALLKKTGLAIGVAFQLIDDVLDCTSTEEELGKPIGSDQKRAKATAVTLLGLDTARQKATELLDAAAIYLNTLSNPTPLIKSLFHQMVNRCT